VSAPLTWLCLLPLGAGLLALALRRGGRVAACAGASLAFLFLLALGLRFEAGAAGTLRALTPALAEARIAARVASTEVVRERVAKLAMAGLTFEEQADLAEALSGRVLAREQLSAAQVTSDVAAIHSGELALRQAGREERRLRAALGALEGEFGTLRRANKTSLGDAAFPELRAWLPGVRSQWFVALDGVGLLAGLAATLLALCCSLVVSKGRQAGGILLGTALILVAAVAQDALLFAAAWTGFVLLGAGSLIRVVGGDEEQARQSVVRFLVPGLLGAFVLGGACLWLTARAGSLDLPALQATAAGLDPRRQALLLLAFVLAAATRLPLPPFHGWFPASATHVDPGKLAFLQGGSLILGTLGLVRLAGPCAPAALTDPRVYSALFAWGALSAGFMALAALGERDLRRQAALSASCLSGVVIAGFVLGEFGQSGALLEGTVGGLAGAAALLAAGITSKRGGADAVALGGVGKLAPRLATASALAALALAGLPLSASFAARAHVLRGAWANLPSWAVLLSLAPLALLGLGLWWSYQRVFLGERRGAGRVRDLDLLETSALATLLLAVVLVGLDPLRWLELLTR
jgi:NADH-quinone oxidoreductase subunit M